LIFKERQYFGYFRVMILAMRVLLLCLVMLSFGQTEAQIFYRRSELGAAGGASHYFGDINPDYSVSSPSSSASIFYRYNLSRYIAFKFAGSYANIGSDDKFSSDIYQKTRNLNFRNNIYEVGAFFEFSFFEFNVQDFEHRFTPYVTIGLAAFHHDPFTYYDGRKIRLQPLGTEGQNYETYQDRKYKNNIVAFPFGLGVKYWMARGITFHVEVVQRSTATDYLDDVSTTYVGKEKFIDLEPSPYPTPAEILQDRSVEINGTEFGKAGRQRGVSTTRDKYMLLQLGFSFRLPTYKCPDEF
jgi:hypothetical protein